MPIETPSIVAGYAKREIGCEVATMAAAPSPCTVRAAMSVGKSCAIAQDTDAMTKTATPTR